MQRLKQVYDWLEDEQSKSIFLNRMCYNLTGDSIYIQRIVEAFLPELPKRGGVYRKGTPVDFYQKLKHLPLDRPIVIYGAGTMGNRVLTALSHRNDVVFCDRSPELQKDGVRGIRVIAPAELIAEYSDACVVVTMLSGCDEIYSYLLENGFSKQDILLSADYYMRAASGQYFDPEIITFQETEIFVDCGCLNFLTGKELLERCQTVKKIHAFEPSPKEYAACEMRSREYAGETAVHLYPYGVWSRRERLRFADNGGNSCISQTGTSIIEAVALDEIIAGEVTFIKMDIEGAEYEALKGAERIIKQYRPKLAICVYHKPEDIVEIPLLINAMVPEYRLFMRHYSNDRLETVLYAV